MQASGLLVSTTLETVSVNKHWLDKFDGLHTVTGLIFVITVLLSNIYASDDTYFWRIDRILIYIYIIPSDILLYWNCFFASHAE